MATPPQILDDAATPPGGALPAMAIRALAPAPDRDAFAEASAAALGASDSTALVALRFPAKPKRAGDKRIPLRERMAAAELR